MGMGNAASGMGIGKGTGIGTCIVCTFFSNAHFAVIEKWAGHLFGCVVIRKLWARSGNLWHMAIVKRRSKHKFWLRPGDTAAAHCPLLHPNPTYIPLPVGHHKIVSKLATLEIINWLMTKRKATAQAGVGREGEECWTGCRCGGVGGDFG